MSKEFSHVQKLKLVLSRRNKIISSKYDKCIKKILKNGSKLFKKYNYYIYLLTIIVMYTTITLTSYLKILNSYKYDNYNIFLEQVFNIGIAISIFLTILYIYSLISYMSYPLRKLNKIESIDALVINFVYFLILSYELNCLKNDYLDFTLILSIIPIILFFYFKYTQVKMYIKNYNDLILKIFFLIVFSFFVINFKYVVFSVQLINNNIMQHAQYKIYKIVNGKMQVIKSNLTNE